MLEFLTFQKGTKKLVLNSFLFTKHRPGLNGSEIWRCEVRTCRVKIHTKDNDVISTVNEHIHAAFHGKIAVANVRTAIKRRAEETEEPTRRIVQLALTQVSAADAHLLPSRIICNVTLDVIAFEQEKMMIMKDRMAKQ